jgi:hypothetical protein
VRVGVSGHRPGPTRFGVGTARQYRLTESFIAARSGGDPSALIALLDPEVAGDVNRGDTLQADVGPSPGQRRWPQAC